MRLSPLKDEDLGNLKVIHKLILPHCKESEETTSKPDKSAEKMEPGSYLDLVEVVESILAMGDPVSGYIPFRRKTQPPGLVTSRRRRKARCR